jgi:deoxyribodipyrimidine photo-lyase
MPVRASGSHRGGQSAADEALAAFDVTGYAATRSLVEPVADRGASGLSPWIRHGLLPLRRVWDHVGGGPARDVERFRDELLWQEYARHLHARLGDRTRWSLRGEPESGADEQWSPDEREMACVGTELRTLEQDGWVTNQSRLWLASQWSVRGRRRWQAGEDLMFRSLLDGSRSSNRLGWQWTSGAGSARPHVWTRAQVEQRAPGRCAGCARRDDCPVETAPQPGHLDETVDGGTDQLLRRDDTPWITAGPQVAERSGGDPPDTVWVTAESLGDDDPALVAHPDRPAVFVFDEPLLARLRLSGTRLVFLTECLADLATRRPVEVHLGDPSEVLRNRHVATTAAPVPGNRRHRSRLGDAVAETHPWPWLVVPHDGSVRSFSAWRRRAVLPGAAPTNRR